jgi:hypothetical protein
MALRKVGVTKLKLKTGEKVEGYLLSAVGKTIQTVEGTSLDLCKVLLKNPAGQVTETWLGDSSLPHTLVRGEWTVITKEETEVDGEKGTKTTVEQDDAKKITV